MNKKDFNQKNQRIQVFARCRPLNSNEKRQGSPGIVEVVPDKKILVKDRNVAREFLFDKVFGPDTKQISVYKSVVEPLIQEVLTGYNCTVFAYGQTGTGKTYTMEGERSNSKCSWENDPGAGIIPRSLHQLFENLNREENVEFSVRVSFLELYNEELFDLLSPTELSRLRLFEDSSKKGSVIIQGLEEVIVNSKDEVYAILEKGTARRQTAATMLNASSSRSHTVFSVTVHIKENTIEGEELLKTGKLNLVDLAGSENVGRSGAVDKRAREAGSINQSLLTLGRVITALIEKQPHVPYRESKLTRLLQDSLGGHTKTSIIATVSPALCNFDETVSTLDYATKAKSITIKPEANQKMTKRALIKEYTEEIERLRRDLVALRCKEGFFIDLDNYMNLTNEITEKTELIKQLSEKICDLKEENMKIEEMFKTTKEELDLTSEKLNSTTQKYEKTEEKLSATTNALNLTKKVLTDTAIERDEKQFLINIQTNTEKKLSQQAQHLLGVTEETIDDLNKLHSKIDRKNKVEKTNEEKCQDFRVIFQKQFALLDDLVSSSEHQQLTNLSTLKQYLGKVTSTVQVYQSFVVNFLNEVQNKSKFADDNLMKSLKAKFELQNDSIVSCISNSKCHLSNLDEAQSSFLSNELQNSISEMKRKTSVVENFIQDMHEKINQKVENQILCLSRRSQERKLLLSSISQTLESFSKEQEEIINDFQLRTSHLSQNQQSFKKSFADKLKVLKDALTSFEEFGENQEMKIGLVKLENDCSRHKASVSHVKEVIPSINKLIEIENLLHEDHTHLNSIIDIFDIKQFSVEQEKLLFSQVNLIDDFTKFSNTYKEENSKLFQEIEHDLNNQCSTISDHVSFLEENMKEKQSSLQYLLRNAEVSCNNNLEAIQQHIQKTENIVNESESGIHAGTLKLKDEILKRDIEFEKFISEDLQKDIPTGTTPQRKTYYYPRLLAATSPHERILQRYRNKVASEIELAQNTPLDSGFNEVDELSENFTGESPVDVLNSSLTSEESTNYDTDASSVSDSTEIGKNKENLKIRKKRSRLPKKFTAKKEFIIPSVPSIRKPLGSSNTEQPEL